MTPGPSAGITKAAGAVPDDEVSDLWKRFVLEACGGDHNMALALQVALGSAAFGHNRDHLCHIVHGDGGTGKSVLLETAAAALGDYAGALSAAVLSGRGDRHATFLAALQGVRFATVPELGGGALRSETVKAISAGDRLQANFMRRDTFWFRPVASLWIATNDLPALRTVDQSLRRRLRVWPFDHVPDSPDVTLPARLRSREHLGGVLRWLLDGAMLYADRGAAFMGCDPVRQATAHYFETVDTVGQWAAAHIRPSIADGWTATAILYRSYTTWCETERQRPVSAAGFATWLGRRYEPKRNERQRGFAVLLDSDEPGES